MHRNDAIPTPAPSSRVRACDTCVKNRALLRRLTRAHARGG